MDKDEFARATNLYITDYIKFADAKAGALLGFVGLLMGGLGVAAQDLLKTIRYVHWICFIVGGSIFFAVISLVAIVAWYCIAALQPRTPKAAAGVVLTSYPDLAELSVDEAVERVSKLTTEDIAGQYTAHNVTLARIVRDKFDDIKKGVGAFRLLLLASLAFLIFFVIVKGLHPADEHVERTESPSTASRMNQIEQRPVRTSGVLPTTDAGDIRGMAPRTTTAPTHP